MTMMVIRIRRNMAKGHCKDAECRSLYNFILMYNVW